jgi:hypothetical protein
VNGNLKISGCIYKDTRAAVGDYGRLVGSESSYLLNLLTPLQRSGGKILVQFLEIRWLILKPRSSKNGGSKN